MEAPTTLRLRRRVIERHIAAARQNLPRGKAVPSQYITLCLCSFNMYSKNNIIRIPLYIRPIF